MGLLISYHEIAKSRFWFNHLKFLGSKAPVSGTCNLMQINLATMALVPSEVKHNKRLAAADIVGAI